MSNNPILEIQQVNKSFGGLKALDNVSFSVQPGELLGIAGPNGSGKSTLFNVISRIPFGVDSGTILFNGQRIDGMKAHHIAALGLARTFQKDAEFPNLSARETIDLAAVYGARIKKPRRLIEEQLELLEFDLSRIDMPTTELSVYERKQTMSASALVMKPKVLMLDEPASGLTKPEIESLDRLLRKINNNSVTVVLIEHVLTLLLSVAQRLIVLNEGKLLAQGDPKAVFSDPLVIDAYLGKRAA
jgi:branched-chain amino acid transport system ATP-binding protein